MIFYSMMVLFSIAGEINPCFFFGFDLTLSFSLAGLLSKLLPPVQISSVNKAACDCKLLLAKMISRDFSCHAI